VAAFADRIYYLGGISLSLSSKERPIVQSAKAQWQRPSFSVTGTGFEVTMYLGTQTEIRK
jgi:coenzyme PQQ precursor peptide PqqA